MGHVYVFDCLDLLDEEMAIYNSNTPDYDMKIFLLRPAGCRNLQGIALLF